MTPEDLGQQEACVPPTGRFDWPDHYRVTPARRDFRQKAGRPAPVRASSWRAIVSHERVSL